MIINIAPAPNNKRNVLFLKENIPYLFDPEKKLKYYGKLGCRIV